MGSPELPPDHPPQDVVAIFHASFHPTQGNVIDWSLKASETLDISQVEFSCLPSGLHLVDQDVVYFTKDDHQGVCVFRRRQTSEHGHRGFRLSSLGILLAKSVRSRPWRHVSALKALLDSIYSSLENREALEPTESDWDPARLWFEARKVNRADLAGAGDWQGWNSELGGSDMRLLETSPTIHLPHLLRILGPSSLTLYKYILGRRRILVYTAPPVEAACVLCQVAADICFEDQISDQQQPHGGSSRNPTSQQEGTPPADESTRKLKGKSAQPVKVLGMVTLNDLDKLEQETATGRGWIACTTDAIFLEKPGYYDLLIDLTTVPSKSSRATLHIPKLLPGGKRPSYRLSAVRFTWSDVKLWTELEQITRDESGGPGSCCCPVPAVVPGKHNNGPPSAWADIWRVYEDACVLCAGLWMGSWKAAASLYANGGRQRGGDWGAIHLDGDDDLSTSSVRRKRDESYVYVRNLGMGIEGRPSTVSPRTRAPSENGTLHNRGAKYQRRSSAMSLWTWASGRTPNEGQGSGGGPSDSTREGEQEDDEVETIDEFNRRQEQQIITTLALLQVFHRHTSHLLTRLSRFLPDEPSSNDSASRNSSKSTISLSPRDVMSVELGPLSALDVRFVEWLVDEYGSGVKVVVKRGWRDLFGLMLGFG